MKTQIFQNLRIIGVGSILPPKDKGHYRVAFKVSSKFSSKKTPIFQIDGVKDIEITKQALLDNRLVAKRAKIITSPRGDVVVSIRDFEIISISDDIYETNDSFTGELVLVSLHEKETNMTKKKNRIETDAALVAECVSISGTGSNYELFKLFLRKDKRIRIKMETCWKTSRGNRHREIVVY